MKLEFEFLDSEYKVEYFCDDDKILQGRSIDGVKILSHEELKTKIGKEHSKFLVEPILENEKLCVNFISSKNRIANTTKKRLLLAFIDNDNCITYIENKWLKL